MLHFERRVALSPMRVREALLAAQCADAVDADERWDVEDDRAQSRLALTAWIDAADVETAAGTGAAFHSRFDEVVRAIEQDAGQVSSDGADLALVTDAYRSAFAAALADTD